MRLSYYCQHVLGIGHLKRSLEICRHLSQDHETTLILGGPATSFEQTGLNIVQLPGLKMDEDFQNLVPCDQSRDLEATKKARKRQLYRHFEEYQPHCFLTELYPFGRKAFRFELDPILEDIKQGILPTRTCICSVRDILVEKLTGQEKWEKRVISTLNNYFTAILVHADDSIITLNETFGPIDKVRPEIYYTGFVSEAPGDTQASALRTELGIGPAETLIVASTGGGNVGSELLLAAGRAFSQFSKQVPNARLQLFTGPYCADDVITELQGIAGSGIHIHRYSDRFTDWLIAADLSLSMAGYNTCMNLLQTGVPALVYPFRQNREQTIRAQKLQDREPLTILSEQDLLPENLSKIMYEQLQRKRGKSRIQLNGAAQTLQIINKLHK